MRYFSIKTGLGIFAACALITFSSVSGVQAEKPKNLDVIVQETVETYERTTVAEGSDAIEGHAHDGIDKARGMAQDAVDELDQLGREGEDALKDIEGETDRTITNIEGEIETDMRDADTQKKGFFSGISDWFANLGNKPDQTLEEGLGQE